MANVAGSGGSGFWKAPPQSPKPTSAPSRKAAIDKLVSQSFTATGQGTALIAKRFKAMNLSPDELDYVKHSSATRGKAARQKADPWGDMVANALQFGINPHTLQHPIARLEGKGEFAPKDTVGRDASGKPIKGYASMLPWFGGGEGKAAEEITSVAKAHPLISAKPTGVVLGPKTLSQTATEGLQGTKGLRKTQEKLRSIEKASRAQEYGKALQQNPTIAGHHEASQLLAGKYPELHFGGYEDLSPETLDTMTRHVADSDLLPLSQKRAIDGLKKIHGGKLPTKSEEKLIRQVFGPEVTKELKQAVSKFHQVKSLAYDVGNIPRSIMASYDASGIMRQGLLIGTGHPVIFAKNIPGYLKAIKSEDFYQSGLAGLRSRPNAVNGVYEKMGVDITEMSPRASAASREESFRSPLAEKLFGVRQSGRGFTLYLDSARADLADYMYAKALKEGRDINDSHLLESIGDVVNSSSGRGDLGEGVIGRSQEGLNLLLFSPRLIKSRVDFINPVWYAKLDPLARHQAYKAMGGLVVLVATALSIARAVGGQVNLDPRSSDFAKIRLGNTRLDLAGGFQQYMRLLSELATQSTVNTSGVVSKMGKEGPGKTSDWDVAFRFIRSKLAPLASASVDLSQRQNAVGQPITWQNQIASRLTPLSGQDALSVGEDAAHSTHSTGAGVLAGIGAFGLSAIGGGVQNYKPKQPNVKTSNDPWGSSGGSDSWGSSGGGSNSFWGN